MVKVSEKVEFYLNRLGDKTRPVSESILNQFFEYSGENGGKFKDYTPDGLIKISGEKPWIV